MYNRRRRSSILKKGSEDETADDGSTKLKRRISFSGKKSIRGEEETQAWNNSYEESDNAINASSDAEKKVGKTFFLVKRASNIKPDAQHELLKFEKTEIDKENIYMGRQNVENDIPAPLEQPQNNISKIAPAHRNSGTSQKCVQNSFATSLYATMDFINNTHQIDSLHIENSVDVSLHDREYVHPVRSFSIEEFEREALLNAKRVSATFGLADVSWRESLIHPTDEAVKSTAIPTNIEGDAKANRRTVLSKENMEESILGTNKQTIIFGSHTINIDDPISATTINRDVQILKRKTISSIKNMDVSLMDIEQVPKVDNNPTVNYTSMDLSRVDCDQELVSPMQKKPNKDRKCILNIEKESKEFSEKLKEISLQAESDESSYQPSDVSNSKQQDKRCELPMDISMEIEDFPHSSDQLSSNWQLCEDNPSKLNKKSVNCKKDKRESSQNIALSFNSPANNSCKNKAKDSRKTIIFDTKSSKLDISKSTTTPPFRSAKNKSKSSQNFDLSSSPSAFFSHEKERRDGRKTIIFDKSSQLDISKLNTTQSTASAQIKIGTNLDEAFSKLDFTQPSASPKASPKISETVCNSLVNNDKKGALPKVVLVRKICTPKQKQEAIKDLELQRFHRYINKEKGTKSTCNETTSHVKLRNEISSSNQSIPLSPINMSSPLFSNEYVQASNKKLNFRQLNDEIELGKLKIFSKTCEKNIKKPNSNVLQDNTKNSSAITHKKHERNGESDTKPFEKGLQNLSRSQSKEKSDALHDKTLHAEDKNLIFSEANEMQLEDTLFLTQTKLGDETITLHQSKCSNTKIENNSKTKLNFDDDERIGKTTFNECEDLEHSNKQTLIHENITNEEKINKTNNNNAPIEIFGTEVTPYSELGTSANLHEQMDITNLEQGSIYSQDFQKENASLNTSISEKDYDFDVKSYKKHNKNDDCSNTIDCNTSLDRKNPCIAYNKTNKESDIEVDIEELNINTEDSVLNAVSGLNANNNKTKTTKRQTIYYSKNSNNDVDTNLTLCHSDTNKNSFPDLDKVCKGSKRQTLIFKEGEDMDLDDMKVDTEEKKTLKVGLPNRHTTFHFSEENQMDADHSLFSHNKTITNFNVAKLIISKQSSVAPSLPIDSNALEDSLNLQLKEMRETMNKRKTNIFTSNNSIGYYESPKVNSRRQAEAMRRLYDGTPHRSVIEFEDLEIEMETKLNRDKLDEFEFRPKPELHAKADVEHKRRFSSYNPEEIDLSECLYNTNLADMPEVVKKDNQRKIIFSSQEEAHNAESAEKRELIKSRNTIYETAAIVLEESGLKLLDIDDEKDDLRLNSSSAINVGSESSRKRSTINLTPIHPIAKKRQTQDFTNCNMDEPLNNTSTEEQNVSQQPEELVDNEEIENVNDSCGDQHVVEISAEVSEIRLNVIDEDLKNSPVRLQTSRIPIHIGSAKKNNSILTRFLSPLKTKESNLDHSLETIAIPRQATYYNRKDSILPALTVDEYRKSHDNVMQFNDTQSKPHFEENPITISDVSVFYMSQREKTAAIHREYPNEGQQLRESSEDNTVNNIAKLKKAFSDLTCESPLLSSCLDDIDKTRLSLVETLLDDDDEDDDDDDDDDDEIFQVEEEKLDTLQLTSNLKACLAQTPAASVRTLRNASAVCRKCMRCQETILNETFSSADSFVLPEMPTRLDLGLDRLKKWRSKLSIAEVEEYWRRGNSTNNTITSEDFFIDQNVSPDEEDGEEDEADIFIKSFRDRMKRAEIEIAERRSKKVTTLPKTFVKRLETKLSSGHNWIFDYQMQYRNMYQFDHRKIITFSVIISYLEMDPFGYAIEIKNIKLQPSRVPLKNWQPYSYVLDFQLKLELPFSLSTLCAGSDVDSVFDMLNEIDRICVDVEKLGRSFWKLVCKEKGSLIRELNSIYVRKIVRSVLDPLEDALVKEVEFKVAVTNLRRISYKDIVAPPLHLFREDIQYLPIGLDFLAIFLKDPTSHLNN